MIQTSEIGNRHLRALSGFEDQSRPLRVRIVAGEAFASPAAQHLTACLCNLLCRLVGSVSDIQISLPPDPWRVPTGWPGGDQAPVEALISLSDWATGGLIPISIDAGSVCDFTICIGSRPNNFEGQIDLCAHGSGWRAWAGREAECPVSGSLTLTDTNPLGPYLAACLAAGEVFKRARRPKRGAEAENFGYSLWTGRQGVWPTLDNGPPLQGMVLPPLYIVGAGAVGQGLHAVLAAAQLGAAYLVTIDDDSHDETNLNRCFVSGVDDVDGAKVDAITRSRTAAGLDGLEFKGTLSQYVMRTDRSGLREDIAALEAEDRYPLVISAVDKNTSRQDIQGLSPSLVIGGSTVGLSAKANVYDMVEGTPCLACHNPPEDDGARLREVEQRVRSMSDEEKRAFLDGKVGELDRVMAYLQGAERCGSIGEAAFKAFATAQEPEFSVSFVSMAAATLLAGRLITRVGAPDSEDRRPRMSTIAFRNLGTGDDLLSRDQACTRCGRDA